MQCVTRGLQVRVGYGYDSNLKHYVPAAIGILRREACTLKMSRGTLKVSTLKVSGRGVRSLRSALQELQG